MTDDRLDEQLTAELKRRAASANLARDWSQRVLLPAVTSGIDSRTQPVVTSRWSPFAGLTAVVGILLVMVVALPRLAPGPAATAPANGSNGALSAAEFASQFVAEQLNGKTVLVDGRIRQYDGEGMLYGNVCGQGFGLPARPAPDYACVLGRLDGVEQSVWVNSPYVATPASEASPSAEPAGWSWQSPQPPIEGRLVLRVSDAGFVEYVGTVLGSKPEPISVREANQVPIASTSIQDVLLVRAWLWSAEGPGRAIDIDCAPPRVSPVPDLPNDYCEPRDSLLSQQPPSGEPLELPGARMSVQRGAAAAFGGTVGRDPRIFAVSPRLHAACFTESPCREWEVVARLTAKPPQPLPTDVPTAIDCASAPGGENLPPVQIIDQIGLVTSCQGVATPVGGTGPSGLSVRNPPGDLSALDFFWSGDTCALGVEITFFERSGRYWITPYERPWVGAELCAGMGSSRTVEIDLSRDLLAELVTATRFPPITPPVPTARPTPAPIDPGPTPQPSPVLECGPTQPPDPYANLPSAAWTGFALDDQPGLVERCEAWEFQPADATRMTVTNPNGDVRVLELTWGEACANYSNISFNELPSGFEIVPTSTMPDNATCDGVVYARGLRLYLREPVAADTVSTRVIFTPAVTPSQEPLEFGPAWWELAPTERPTADSTRLDVVVFERECANGESPEGRLVGPEIDYGELTVTVTFQVRPLPGGGDCPAAPGAPVTVELSEALGERRPVDGGFASTDRVLEHGDGLLWVLPLRSQERATARLETLLGPEACPVTMSSPRAVDEAKLEQLANDLGTDNGVLGDGLAWLGDAESAVRGLGGFELYQGRDRAWYVIALAEDQPWLADGVDAGDLVLADVTTLPISGGRTIWILGRYLQTFGSLDCQWDSDSTAAAGPRADAQGLGFSVSIKAPSASWTVGQSLDGFGAVLEYSGAEDPITIVGSGSGIAFAYWTRLDGAPRTPPLVFTADCKSYQMASGDERAIPMYPAPGFSYDGASNLPPGIWRLTAFTGFAIGGCGGQEPALSASIVVRVR